MKIINIGILAHVDAGKTTLTESLLYTSGAIPELGSVDKGTTRTDTMLLERQRGITIQTAVTSFYWKNYKINIVDTPGHMDFLAEVYRSLAVLDGAILVVSAKDGVQAQTRVLFHALQKMKIPTIIFVNKIDQEGIDLQSVYQNIREKLSGDVMVMQDVSLTPEVSLTDIEDIEKWDSIIAGNDELLEKYIDQGMPVVFWACINMRKEIPGPEWKLLDSGESFCWISNEHCMLLVGYDEKKYYFNDPYDNNGVIGYERELVEKRHVAQHSMAIGTVTSTDIKQNFIKTLFEE